MHGPSGSGWHGLGLLSLAHFLARVCILVGVNFSTGIFENPALGRLKVIENWDFLAKHGLFCCFDGWLR